METIRPDGTGRRRLGEFSDVSWSASGRRLIGVTLAGLVLAERRGRALRTIGKPIGPDGVALDGYQPSIAPDGRTVAFVHDVQRSNAQPEQIVPWIWTVDTVGARLRRLAPGARPRWTPDGQRIVFERYDAFGSYLGIASMRRGGRRKRMLLRDVRLLDLAPDGRRLLWWGVHRRTSSRRSGVVGLFTSDLHGRRAHQISDSHPSGSAAWSPDGTKVVFPADDVGFRGTFTANATGGGVRRLLRHPHYRLSWQPRPR
jgi:Tol biopolymer transport system component